MRPKKKQTKRAAKKAIAVLFSLAEKERHNPSLTTRLIKRIRSISQKAGIRLLPFQRRFYCRHCNHYLYPGISARIRIRKGKKIMLCLHCKHLWRIPYKPLKKEGKNKKI